MRLQLVLSFLPLLVGASIAAEWTYTDGNGVTVTLPETPVRIVAEADAAAGLMAFGIRPVGVFGSYLVDADRNLSQLDLSGIDVVGSEWGSLDLEKVLALDPDIIIAEYWPQDGLYAGAADDSNMGTQLRRIAPIAGPRVGTSVLTLIEDYAVLSESLGADVNTIADGRATFDTALAAFKASIADKPGLTVMAASPLPDHLYVAVPAGAPELSDFQSWGLDLVEPNVEDPFWDQVSWENATRYQPDLILLDDRAGPSVYDVMNDQPTAQRIRAVAAGAMADWPAFWIRSFSTYAAELDKLRAVIDKTDPTVGD